MLKAICLSTVLLCALALPAQTPDDQRLFQDGVAAQQRGDDAAALRIYQQLLQSHPEAVAVRANLGATLAHFKRYDEAIEQYRLVLSADPGNRPVWGNLALAYEGKGDYARAAKELELLHKAVPGDAQTALLLADCYSRLGRYADSVSMLKPLERSQPDDLDLAWLLGSALIHVGRSEEGLQRIDRLAKKAASADAYLLAGQTRLALTQYDLARRDADAAQRLNPTLSGLQTLYGMILEQTGDFAGAENVLRAALQADPKDFNANFYLGAILYFKRDMKDARMFLERSLQLRPSSAQARYELALVSRAEGKLVAAVMDLETVVHQNPDWLQPHIELSALYFRLNRPEDGAKEKAIVDRLTALQQGPAPGPMP
jgi:tetratricopeptide (TPR) repeat protein